jgi:hypothetical protein
MARRVHGTVAAHEVSGEPSRRGDGECACLCGNRSVHVGLFRKTTGFVLFVSSPTQHAAEIMVLADLIDQPPVLWTYANNHATSWGSVGPARDMERKGGGSWSKSCVPTIWS